MEPRAINGGSLMVVVSIVVPVGLLRWKGWI